MISQLFKTIGDELKMRRNPVGFFRSQGVIIGEGTIFYGPQRSMFSTEPFLVKIGRDCHISFGALFIPHDGGALLFRKRYPEIDVIAPIIVGDRVFIGSRAMILAGATIGNDSIVGAGAVVTKDVPPGVVVAGVPARPIKSTAEYEAQALRKSVNSKHLPWQAKREFLLSKYHSVLHPPAPETVAQGAGIGGKSEPTGGA